MESKVLIVDDEKSVIQQVKTLIDSFGYKSFYIPRAEFLSKRLESESFDLILMDINMPGIDGITALRQLKADPTSQDIPVIMMTGDTNDETLEACFNYGAADYITKPISELVMKARVKSVLDKQEYIKEIFAKNEELKSQKQELHAQKDEIEAQRKIAVAKSQALLISEQKIQLAHNNITASINYAKTIQNALLPPHKLFKRLFQDSFVLFKPRDVVSGDFFWAHESGNQLIVVAADCTGHGVPGAFLSILGISFLNELMHANDLSANLDPADLLNQLRDMVKTTLGQTTGANAQKDGMDIAVILINKEQLTMSFAGAYNPLLLVRNKAHSMGACDGCIWEESDTAVMLEIKGDRQPIGVYLQERPFTSKKGQLVKGDVLYLFSDGFADQTGGENKTKYLKKQFKRLLMSIHNDPMAQQEQILKSTLLEWMGPTGAQIDDILVMGFKI